MEYEVNYVLLARTAWGAPQAYKEGLKELIDELLPSLPYQRHATVLKLRFGLDDGTFRTLAETGKLMGVTGNRIRQLQQKAIWRLQCPPVLTKVRAFLFGEKIGAET